MLWASVLMTIGMPSRFAAAQWTSSRSRRAGLALSSSSLPRLAAVIKHGFEIDGVRFAAIDQPPGRVGDDRDVRILERAEDPIGDLLARLLLSVVDAGDDPVGFGQHIVRRSMPPASRMSHSMPLRIVKSSNSRLSRSISSHWARSRVGIEAAGHAETRCEWSVIAMYWSPR